MDSLQDRLPLVALQIVPFLVAIVFHEFAHGWVAHRWGDPTAKDQGRLTLNPWPHMDVLGTIIFPLFCMLSGAAVMFGWAKPVPIDPRRFKKFRPGLFWVSSAGVLMNFAIAILSAAMTCAIVLWMPKDFYLYEPLLAMTVISVSINFALGIFNLIPLPPLDGSKVIESMLPIRWALQYEKLARLGGTLLTLLFLVALFTNGAFNPFALLSEPIRFLTQLTLGVMARVFQLPELSA